MDCKDCTNRYMGCHDTCRHELQRREKRLQIATARREYNGIKIGTHKKSKMIIEKLKGGRS